MACGLPVVATDCPHGPSEIIDNGVTGWLTNLDAKDLADKMEWMIVHQEERKIMGVKAHKAAAAYRKDVIMKKWESAYKPESI
jgi:glycosyltransferase involved in cell wall biosynthesis